MSHHTPEWVIRRDPLEGVRFSGRPDEWERFLSVEMEGFPAGGGIALVHMKQDGVGEAHARLISAAPELLKALEEFCRLARSIRPADPDLDDALGHCEDRALDAIRKARGES